MHTNPKLEADLRRWSRDHHGVIGRHEGFRIGASGDVMRAKLESGAWANMYYGVYRDAAAPQSPYQTLRGAFVATRGLGVISHTSAAWLWGLLPEPPERPELSVRPGTGETKRIAGLAIHQSGDLDVSQAVAKKGVLVTNPMRTLVDLAGTVSPAVLTDAVDGAIASKLLTMKALTAELDRLAKPGRPGIGRLRYHLLDRGFIGEPAPSVLEAKTRRIILAAGLALPTLELRVGEDGEYRLDFAWPAILLCVEVDGYLWHFSPEHARRDHNRRNRLQDAGWNVRVYTWRDVCDEPSRVGREIAAAYRSAKAA